MLYITLNTITKTISNEVKCLTRQGVSIPGYFKSFRKNMRMQLTTHKDISDFISGMLNLVENKAISNFVGGKQATEIFEYGLSGYIKETKIIHSICIESYLDKPEDKRNTVTLEIVYNEDVDTQEVSVLNFCFLHMFSWLRSGDKSGYYISGGFGFLIELVEGRLKMEVDNFIY
jgi:hypothetical protein